MSPSFIEPEAVKTVVTATNVTTTDVTNEKVLRETLNIFSPEILTALRRHLPVQSMSPVVIEEEDDVDDEKKEEEVRQWNRRPLQYPGLLLGDRKQEGCCKRNVEDVGLSKGKRIRLMHFDHSLK
mmetsp:Transcript_8323/g.10705  ORF Transcript_8323/g.10705 Transcript_8323/m.10705 type:complete len:125 (-) Transcript_8323:280-654(-)|eukprot:CAMPEP_0116050714 /NCGR_PEP_ID=MMETSP0322-20121206/546_1 /TAXON_ID=163516 /ORGANISM="Leptocylindrus danicus var. apora, Strain B651" /LENGTH=124 /DNA_ID=CAMNT_0003533319 /DNA_START=375 /DNA_END=749 /DNA_ORIENTATION=+